MESTGTGACLGAFDAKWRETPLALDIKTLHTNIGQLTLVNDFLEVALGEVWLLSVRK